MCAPAPPAPPDYVGQAKAQGEANKDAAIASSIMSNPNIITPYGSQTVSYDYGTTQQPVGAYNPNRGMDLGSGYDPTGGRSYAMPSQPSSGTPGGVPVPTVTQSFSPEQQKLYDQQTQISSDLNDTALGGLGRVNDMMGSSFDMAGFSDVSGVDTGRLTPRTVQGTVGGQDEIYQAMMDREASRFGQRRDATEADLLARGFNPGGSGYDNRIDEISRAENDFSLGARLNAGQEQQRLFDMESRDRAQGLNEQTIQQQSQAAERARQIQEALMVRQLPLNEINALRTGNQSTLPQFQQFSPTSVGAAPIMDAAIAGGNFAQQNYQNQVAGSGGLFDLAGAVAGGPIGGRIAKSIFS